MFRRDTFVLIAAALIGIVLTIYLTIGATQFFPEELQRQQGECPPSLDEAPDRRPVVDEFYAQWYGDSLLAFHEEPLFERKNERQGVVRFTYLRSFHAPVMVRTVETTDGQVRLIAKWMTGWDGCTNREPACVIDRVLTEAERTRLQAIKAPLLRTASFGCLSGVDGSTWIIEAAGHGDYRMWHQWSPHTGGVRDLGLTMLELTGWHFAEIY